MNENKLIYTKEFWDNLTNALYDVLDFPSGKFGYYHDTISDVLHQTNAVEVAHGHWDLADDGDGIVCSVCGTDFCILLNETDNFHYCPHCGANMRGGNNA